MSRTKQAVRAGSSDNSASSSSSVDEEHGESLAESSSSTATPANTRGSAAAMGRNEMSTGEDEAAAATAAGCGNLTASERRRQETLFLSDTEQFAFDFGGEVKAIAETVVADDAAQRAARRAEELEDTTAHVIAASALRKSSADAVKLLTEAEVTAFAASALVHGPHRFLTLPKAGILCKRTQTSLSSKITAQDTEEAEEEKERVLAESTEEEGATLAEAILQFRTALRRFDEGLWRQSKLCREEEDRKRNKARKRQRP